MILTDEERLHLADIHVGEPNPDYPLEDGDWINYGKAIESAVLEKLAGMELQPIKPEDHPDNHKFMWSNCELRDIERLRRQAYAQGAASQLSAEPVAHVSHLEQNGRPCIGWNDADSIGKGTKLFTRKEQA